MYIKNTHADPSFTEISVMKHRTAIRLQRYSAEGGIPQDVIPIMQCSRGITPEKKNGPNEACGTPSCLKT